MNKTILIFSLLITGLTFSQSHTNFNTQRNWSLNKKEIFFGMGATNFLGDLGGKDRIGTDFSLADLDWPETYGGITMGYRYRWHPYWATSTEFYSGVVRGDDKQTNEIIRNSRNLHFRSPIITLNQRIECIVLAKEKFGRRYNIAGLKGFKNNNEQLYLFTGIGVTYFNPQAKINGKWTNLRPLSTEGQGLEGGADKYLPVTVSVPFGVGFKMGIGQMWRAGLEVSYVKTFSDYIDDVSTNYYDVDALLAAKGPDAVYASNPSDQNQNWFAPGQQRGDPDEKDAYLVANIIFTKNITYKGGGRRTRFKRPKGVGRTKF